nr:MAG TPA: hypothetical protein [Caudoviricetes sp.]
MRTSLLNLSFLSERESLFIFILWPNPAMNACSNVASG